MPRPRMADAYRRTCSVGGCSARVKGRYRMCRVCRMTEAVKKAARRAGVRGDAVAVSEANDSYGRPAGNLSIETRDISLGDRANSQEG